jgi:glycosyltransferase involved in cell wall biosynthesis
LTTTSPTFSVLTPTLNRPDFLARAIKSVQRQTHHDFEHIVHNVGEPLARSPRLLDNRIKYLEGEKRGPAADFQAALDLARGDIIVPLADDDRLPPHALERAAALIGDHEWLCARTVIVNDDGIPVAFRGGTEDACEMTRRGQYMLGGAIFWRKTLTDRVGGFKSEYDGAADFDLYLRFIDAAEPALSDEILYLYSDHAQTDTRVNAGRQNDASRRIAAART